MTHNDIEAYWELANLVKEAADEEGIDLDELAEDMSEEELAEFLDAAMEGASEGFEDYDENYDEDNIFLEKTAELLEKAASGKTKGKKLKGWKKVWETMKKHRGKILLPAGAAVGGLGGYLLRRHTD
jgi:hypothetical protein